MGDLQRKLAGAETQNMSRNQGGEGAKQAQGLATKEGLRGQPRETRGREAWQTKVREGDGAGSWNLDGRLQREASG